MSITPAFVRFLKADATLDVVFVEFHELLRFHRAVAQHLAGHDCDPEKLAEYSDRAEKWASVLRCLIENREPENWPTACPMRLAKVFNRNGEPAGLDPVPGGAP